MTGSHHERLAGLMDERRLELDMKWEEVAAAAGIKPPTLRAIRNGTNHPSPLTMRGIDRALRWEPGSVDAVLAGGTPTVRERAPAGPGYETAEAGPMAVPTDEELRATGLQPETVEALLDMRRHVERLVAKRDEDAIRRANRVLRALDEGQDTG